MESLFTYKTDEMLSFNFTFNILDNNEIKVTIQELNENNYAIKEPYISVYKFQYLNERLSKVIQFKKIEDFRDCLITNLDKKTLVVKPPYKNAVATIWRLFPKETNKKNTFMLISSSNYDRGLSLVFFGENKD